MDILVEDTEEEIAGIMVGKGRGGDEGGAVGEAESNFVIASG